MENHLNQGEKALEEVKQKLDQLETILPNLQELFTYYQSPQWLADLETDDKGQLPDDLARGVLSQDAIYDLLASYLATADSLKTLSRTMTQNLENLKKDWS